MKQQFAAKHPWTILAAGAAIQVLTGLPAAWGVFQQPAGLIRYKNEEHYEKSHFGPFQGKRQKLLF